MITQSRPRNLRRIGIPACLILLMIAGTACRDDKSNPPKKVPVQNGTSIRDAAPTRVDKGNERPSTRSTKRKTVVKPVGRFLFQPKFFYQDREPTTNGTGFLVRAPGSRVAAIASAHFVDFEGSPLLQAKWLSIGDWAPRLKFDKSWGMPGNAGIADGVQVDLRPDYLILPVEEDVPDEWVLRLDKRNAPTKNEVVWFPNKSDENDSGYQWVHGIVVDAKSTYIFVLLEKRIQVQSQSGSPIISSETGRVIGTLSRSSEYDGRTVLWLCPTASIREAIKAATDFPALKDVVGNL